MGPYGAPSPPEPFVDRESVRAELFTLLDRAGRDRAAGALLHGLPGTGSSSVALQFAWDARDRFPDGVLYLPVVGVSPADRPVAAGDLLALALQQLGVPAGELPASDPERASAYRTLTAGRRLLVIVDGATLADQVRPFEPASPAAMVLVTARRRFALLHNTGYRSIRVPPLEETAARQLLTGLLREEIAQLAEPTVADLLRLCAGHPLAIRIVAGALAEQPDYAGRFLEEARTRGVRAFEEDGVELLAVTLDTSYRGLPESLATAYRRLALHPGEDISPDAAAVLLGGDRAGAERALRGLVDVNLLYRVHGRYRFHPLVRRHAERMAEQFDTADLRGNLARRVIDWYRRAGVAWEWLASDRWRTSPAYREIPPAEPTSDEAHLRALDFLRAEADNLEACAWAAVGWGWDDAVRDLCFVLWTPYHRWGGGSRAVDTVRAGVEAARRLGDLPSAMQLTLQTGAILLGLTDLADAQARLAEALDLARRLGHRLGEQAALEWLGKAADAGGDHDAALERFAEADQVPVPPAEEGRVRALTALQRGRVLVAAGRHADAVPVLADAAAYFDHHDKPDNQAKARLALGTALLGVARPADADAPLRRAMELFAADGSLRQEALTWLGLADAARDTGETGREQEHLREAEKLLELLGDAARLRVVRDRLAA